MTEPLTKAELLALPPVINLPTLGRVWGYPNPLSANATAAASWPSLASASCSSGRSTESPRLTSSICSASTTPWLPQPLLWRPRAASGCIRKPTVVNAPWSPHESRWPPAGGRRPDHPTSERDPMADEISSRRATREVQQLRVCADAEHRSGPASDYGLSRRELALSEGSGRHRRSGSARPSWAATSGGCARMAGCGGRSPSGSAGRHEPASRRRRPGRRAAAQP